MHPQLESERFHCRWSHAEVLVCAACYDLIHALDQCHKKEYYKRALGLCNNEETALTKCLHEARVTGERRSIMASRERKKSIEQKWKKMEEEEYGEDAILKKIIQRQVEKRQQTQQTTASGD